VSKINLDQDLWSSIQFSRYPIDPRGELDAIDCMNDLKCFNGVPDFVRLEMPYQVPANVSTDLADFPNSFLHAVLTEIARARINRPLNCR